MRNRNFPGKLILAAISGCLLAVTGAVVFAQSSGTCADWEKAAGGKTAFEVASVKRNVASGKTSLPFPLDNRDGFRSTGGVFSVEDLPL